MNQHPRHLVREKTPDERGLALVVVLLTTTLLSGISLSLLLTLATAPRVSANHHAASATLLAAEAGVELAAAELTKEPDWTRVLNGSAGSAHRDGAVAGMRQLPDSRPLDLRAETNKLTCGRRSGCADTQRTIITASRPWGTNNPAWRPFVYAPSSALRLAATAYIVVWVADDTTETDEDPLRDGGPTGAGRGRGIVRVRAEAFGVRGSRQIVEALAVRRCRVHESGGDCDVGIRVLSWRFLHQTGP